MIVVVPIIPQPFVSQLLPPPRPSALGVPPFSLQADPTSLTLIFVTWNKFLYISGTQFPHL